MTHTSQAPEKPAKKTILVTGAAGLLGSHLCATLLAQGHKVIGLDNYYTGKPANINALRSNPHFSFIEHDVNTPLSIKTPLHQIYNLACPASPKHYQYDPIFTMKTSVIGILNMLDLARTHNATLMQASTSEVYGDPEVHPQTEDYVGHVNPIGPRSCYDEGKRCAETIVMDYKQQYNTTVKIARIFNTYGPNMSIEDGRVVSNFIVQALKNEPITIYGTGEQTRSFCYVEDLINGFIKLMNTTPDDFTGPVNLGNPVEFTMLELAEKVIALTKTKSKLSFHPLPKDDPTQRRPDISLAKKQLNWQPQFQLEEGLKKTIPYFKDILTQLKSKRVLFLSNTPSPYQIDLFNALNKNTNVTGIFTHPKNPKNNANWALKQPQWARFLTGNTIQKTQKLFYQLTQPKPDFIIIGGYKLKFAWLTLLWAKCTQTPVYFWMEAPEPAKSFKKHLKFLAHSLILPRATGIFAIDSRAEAYYKQHHKNTLWLPYAIDATRYPKRPTQKTVKPLKLLFIGQYINRKGILELIEAAKNLNPKEATLTFVGAGPLNPGINALCKKYPHCTNLGFTQPQDLPKIIANHDTLLFPSKYDGWGVVVAEAMAAGLPVISTHDVGAFADLNKQKDAGLFCAPTTQSMLDAVNTYVQNPALHAQHAKNALHKLQQSPANAHNAAEYLIARIVSVT